MTNKKKKTPISVIKEEIPVPQSYRVEKTPSVIKPFITFTETLNDYNNPLDSILNSEPYKKSESVNSILSKLSSTNDIFSMNRFTSPVIKEKVKLENEIHDLKVKIGGLMEDYKSEKKSKEDLKIEFKQLQEELESKESINHITHRITNSAHTILFNDESFRTKFDDGQLHEAVVISIDIRRSTDLMLKAKNPKLFAEFITTLTDKLSEIILLNYGVFDKFTGDGILAFFPKFFSGDEAIVRALKASAECHIIFAQHYYNLRNSFNVFISDVGLGIGVDYGEVHLVNKRKELTIVGVPVVYACRMSGANAGDTLLNLSAYEEFKTYYKGAYKTMEASILIKNEGTALAYKIEFIDEIVFKNQPVWLE